jgi:hypothetical protein
LRLRECYKEPTSEVEIGECRCVGVR